MNTVRTLPIRVAPLSGESIDSWLEAVAYRSETAWGDLLTAVALTSSDNRSNTWVVQLDDAEAAALGAAAGATPAVVHAMTLSHYANRAVGIDVPTGRFLRAFPWGRARGSRYCPHCLADTGGRWQLAWRLGWAFACTQHRCLLADVCPTCHGAQRHRTHITTAIPRPGYCANPAIGQTGSAPARCGTKLADTSVARFDDDHPLLTAQRTVYDVIERGVGDFGVYRTVPQPRRTVLADIRAIAGRILAYAAPEELAQTVPADLLTLYRAVPAHPIPRFGRPHAEDKPGLAAPARAETAAVGVVAAMGILGAGDIDSAGEKMRWLVTGARRQGLAVSATTLGRGRGKSATLYAVQLSALAPLLAPGDQLRYRIGTPTPRRPTMDRARLDRLTRGTPTMLWPAWSLRLATGDCNQKQLRPALSAALLFVETRLRPAPVSGAEAIGAVVRDGHRHDAHLGARHGGSQSLQRDRYVSIGRSCRGQIFPEQPKLGDHLRAPGKEHQPLTRYPRHLADTRFHVAPVVDRQHGQRSIDGLIRQRQRLGDRPHRWRSISLPLLDHYLTGLHRHQRGRWLVRTRPGPHVDHTRRIPKG